MNIEQILTRADAHIITTPSNDGITTTITSHSDFPITKEESKVITRMRKNINCDEKIVFIPQPK